MRTIRFLSASGCALAATTVAVLLACSDGTRSVAPPTSPAVSASKGPLDGPTSVPTRGRILFHANPTGDYEIYSMNEDGTDVVRLTYAPGNDLSAVLSPDGSKIVFRSERDGASQYFVMNPDGSRVKRLTSFVDPYLGFALPSWSPDGKNIALSVQTSVQPDKYSIYVMSASGTGGRFLTAGATDYSPSFSPDGKRIAFASFRTGHTEVWTMNADGTQLEQLTSCYDIWQVDCKSPAWSPDGSKVLFNTSDEKLVTIKLSDKTTTFITGQALFGVWSPDGVKLAFAATGYPSVRLSTINIDGSGIQTLTSYTLGAIPTGWGKR